MENEKNRIALAIPTRNAGEGFVTLLEAIEKQSVHLVEKILLDTESTDKTRKYAKQYGYTIISVCQQQFNHGTTRQLAIDHVKESADIIIFITQDISIGSDDSFRSLLAGFIDDAVAVVYGRQLPVAGASFTAARARSFNYPEQSCRKTYADRKLRGIKTPFLSDSFSAYRIKPLLAAGGFPHVIVGEDMYAGAKLLQAGYDIFYQAEACVYHCHEYTFLQEFRRYFDTGVFHRMETWLLNDFGKAEGEGLKLVLAQLADMKKQTGTFSCLQILLVNFIRYAGYRMGKLEDCLPLFLKKKCSAQSYFFDRQIADKY